MNKHYSKEIAEVVHNFLTKDDWNFEFQEEKGIFRFGLNLKGKIRNVQYIVDIHETDFNVYGLVPISAEHRDDNMMQQLAEFLHRANYGLRNGNFELDFRDGEIRYKTYIECEGLDAPTFEMVRSGIYCTAAMFERYGEGIVKIIFADMDAETAIAICEKSDRRNPFGEEDILEIVDDEVDIPDEAPDEEDSVFPDADALDVDDIADLLRMMREMLGED